LSTPFPGNPGPDPAGAPAEARAALYLLPDTRRARLAAVAILPLLHCVCYWIATRITVLRGPEALIQTEIALDRLIPYVPATWPFYWVAYVYVIGVGGLALYRLSDANFRRAVVAVSAMMIIGAAIQTLFPARAPWPPNPTTSQRLFHDSGLILPYATLPSMHVAYCAFTAGVVSSVLPGRSMTALGMAVVLAVAVSTLTLREHVILDALTGLALATVTLWWWKKSPA